MKKILFVINTLGRAGAETALLELLRRLDAEEYEISLYVLLGQGEMISQVPQRVHVKNKKICTASVLSGAGRRKLIQTSFLAFFRHGRTIKKMQYVIVRNVPCYKCTECNEIIYTADVVEHLEKIVESAKKMMQEISIIDYSKVAA